MRETEIAGNGQTSPLFAAGLLPTFYFSSHYRKDMTCPGTSLRDSVANPSAFAKYPWRPSNVWMVRTLKMA